MAVNEKNSWKEFGVLVGFLLMYLVFATILFFILKLTGKLPENWNYFSALNITLGIVLVGAVIKRILR